MSGMWLPPAAKEHTCSLPIMWPWLVRVGDRWKCGDQLDIGERCGRVWRVAWNDGRRAWVEDKPVPEPEGSLAVFRLVTDEELEYWLNDELGLPEGFPLERRKVVDAIRKHYVIGSRQ